MVEVDVKDRAPTFEIASNVNLEEMGINIKDMLPAMFGSRGSKKRNMRVADAMDYLVQEEEQKLIDMDQVTRIALDRVESSGIIFLDEIDKIAGREGGHGPDVSREGVQRDILPIVEGTTVNTRHGFVRTDHILFIAAGAFHVSKPSDLIPELQGRFPIRVELKSLTVEDFVRILKEPKNALAKQYVALMDTEGIKLTLTDDALEEVAKFAAQVNESSENIGARRLHTIMEKLLEEISFEGPDLRKKNVKVDAAYVRKQLADIVKDQDLSRYILCSRRLTPMDADKSSRCMFSICVHLRFIGLRKRCGGGRSAGDKRRDDRGAATPGPRHIRGPVADAAGAACPGAGGVRVYRRAFASGAQASGACDRSRGGRARLEDHHPVHDSENHDRRFADQRRRRY